VLLGFLTFSISFRFCDTHLAVMLWTTLLAFSALAEAAPSWWKRQGSTTMLRFGCAQVVIDRLDPLVNPGQAPSPHDHQIVGGNAFNASMTTGDVSGGASCTTCAFSDDFSNYWTANLYFKARNGSFKRVKQLGAAYVGRNSHSIHQYCSGRTSCSFALLLFCGSFSALLNAVC